MNASDDRKTHDAPAPSNVDPCQPSWLSGKKDSPQELTCPSQALAAASHHTDARLEPYESLQHLLRQDAFLRYVDESDDSYCVRTAQGLDLTIPKTRAVPSPYPPVTHSPLRAPGRWFAAACIGLMPGGIGALVCAPVAGFLALRAGRAAQRPADRIRIRILLVGSAVVWCIAVLLFILFLMHLGAI